MSKLIKALLALFTPVKPTQTDDKCPYCHGLGYDSSGWTCTCLREAKFEPSAHAAHAVHELAHADRVQEVQTPPKKGVCTCTCTRSVGVGGERVQSGSCECQGLVGARITP
jgi:hypothetical protein